jgi:hypothetical protein
MDGLAVLAVLATGLGLVVALAFLPLALPWPKRVRWTIAAQTMSNVGSGVVAFPSPDLREVVLVSVETSESTLTVRVLEAGHPAADTLTFVDTSPPAADLVSLLHDWCALRTPVLLHVDRSGAASLNGPATTLTNLRGG